MQLGMLESIFSRPEARLTKPPPTRREPLVREGVDVHKTVSTSQKVHKTVSTSQKAPSYDDDEPIFPMTLNQNEAPLRSQPDYWGLGPSGMLMRSRSLFSVATEGSIRASSLQMRGRQQQENLRDVGNRKCVSDVRSGEWMACKRPMDSSSALSTSLRVSPSSGDGNGTDSRPQQACTEEATEDVEDSMPKRGCLRRLGYVRQNPGKRISWRRRGGVVTDTKEIVPYKTDAPDLWYVNGCDMECNICGTSVSSGGTPMATMRGAPGKSKFAQWQAVCIDCFAKERLAEIGGLQVLSFAAKDDRLLRGYMRKMLENMQKTSPLQSGQDTLLHLVRVLQEKGLKVAGCSEDANEIDMRKKALELAVVALTNEEEQQKSALVKKRPAKGAASSRRRSLRIAPKAAARLKSKQKMQRDTKKSMKKSKDVVRRAFKKEKKGGHVSRR